MLHDSIQDILVSDWIFSLARAQNRCLQSRGPALFENAGLGVLDIVFSLLVRFPRVHTLEARRELARHNKTAISILSLSVQCFSASVER